MNSSTPYNTALSLSAVYRSKEPQSYTKEQLQISQLKAGSSPLNFYKSQLSDRQYPRKPNTDLRLTMKATKNEKSDHYLRNTINTNLTPKTSKLELQESPLYKNQTLQLNRPNYKKANQDKPTVDYKKQLKSNQAQKDNYNKLMEKIDKKEKLLSELKELSKTIAAQTKQLSYETKKSTRAEAELANKQKAPPSYTNQDYREILSKSSHTPTNKSKVNISFNSIKDKMVKRGISQIQDALKNKNPEQNSINISNTSNLYSSKPVQKQTSDLNLRIETTPNKSPRNVDSLKATSKMDHLYNSSYTALKNASTISPTKTRQSSSYSSKARRKPTLDDFQIQKELGKGKFGVAYQAIHKRTQAIFALKKITKKMIKDHNLIEQFAQQIKIQNYCEHQNILRLYGFFDDKEHIYLILQFMQQGTLFFQLKKSKTQTLPEIDVATKMKQLASGIKYLHEKGVVHRDIKPENIVMTNGVGKLCDFGWAAICTQRRKTYCGTFDYISPEILEGTEYDMSVDLWCLGILTYELLVGKAPFYHISRKQTMKKILNVENTAIEYPSHLSKHAISFIDNLLKKNPAQRMTEQQTLNHPFLMQVNDKQV